MESETRLIYSAEIDSLDEPNRFLFQCWAADPEIAPLLPPVPVGNRWAALTDARCPQSLAESQPPVAETAAPLVQTRLAERGDLTRRFPTMAALRQEENAAYHNLNFTIGDSDRRDDFDPLFHWPADPAAQLDALAAVAANDGDPILLWALRGSLAALSENAPVTKTQKLRGIAPVVGTEFRILAGEKTAFAFSRSANVRLTDYRCDRSANFAVTVRIDRKDAAATVSFPGADLREKPVYLFRNRIIKKTLREPSQIRRDSAAPDTLLVFGLRDRDRLQIGDLDLTADEAPPTAPFPPLSANDSEAAVNADDYHPVALTQDKTPNGGTRWLGGIPFRRAAEAQPRGNSPTSLPRAISDAEAIYVLYATDKNADDTTLPLLTLDNGGVAPPADAPPRKIAVFNGDSLRIAAYRLPANRRIIAVDAGNLQVFAVTFRRSAKK